VDYQLNTDDLLSDTLLAKLQLFQPFGEANPEPLFTLKQVRLKNVKDVSGHLKFSLATAANNSINGIGFYLAEKIATAKEGPVDITFKLKRSSYRGVQRKEIQLVDLCRANRMEI
jgi:single-stranded-DNA-specific exonuclease